MSFGDEDGRDIFNIAIVGDDNDIPARKLHAYSPQWWSYTSIYGILCKFPRRAKLSML